LTAADGRAALDPLLPLFREVCLFVAFFFIILAISSSVCRHSMRAMLEDDVQTQKLIAQLDVYCTNITKSPRQCDVT
jgi:hypothetical protein